MLVRRRKASSMGLYALIVVFLYWTFGRSSASSPSLWTETEGTEPREWAGQIRYRSRGEGGISGHTHTQTPHKERGQQRIFGKNHVFPGELASPAETLEILIHYLASNPHTVVPSSVFTGEKKDHIDASQVLDFYTPDKVKLGLEIQDLLRRNRHDNPIILLGYKSTPRFQQFKNILHQMDLDPPPLFLDIHGRSTDDIIAPTVEALAGRSDFPMLLLGGQVLDGSQGIYDRFHDYTLPTLLEEYADIGEELDVSSIINILERSKPDLLL